MRRRSLRRLAFSLTFWTLVLGLMPRVALCVGGAHVALELVGASCCAPRTLAGDRQGTSGCPQGCTDSPVGLYAVIGSPEQPGCPIAGTWATATTVPLCLIGADATRKCVASFRLELPQYPPRELRTTIDRC